MEFKHLMFSKTFLFYCLLIIIFTVLNCQQVLKHPINSDVYQPQNMTMYSTDKNIIMSNEIKELKFIISAAPAFVAPISELSLKINIKKDQ